MLSAATRYWERIGTVPWYCLTPEEMTTDCLVWVYDRLHGTVGTVLDEIRWVNGMLCTNMSSGQPQRAYSSLTSFLACVLGISTPMERPMGGRFFEQLEQLCDLIDRDLIPPLVRLITDDRFDRSVVVAVAEWTNNFFPREQHKDRGVLASPVLRTSGVQPSKYVKFRTCEHEGCPLSSMSSVSLVWPRTVFVSRKEKTGFHRCSRCKETTYCSRVCQKADWPRHKGRCDVYSLLRRACTLLSSTYNEALRRLATECSERCTVLFSFPTTAVLENFCTPGARAPFDCILVNFLTLADVKTIHPSIIWSVAHYDRSRECSVVLRTVSVGKCDTLPLKIPSAGGCELLPLTISYLNRPQHVSAAPSE
jgi:hypothetical protein